jgi:hypothetical protein
MRRLLVGVIALVLAVHGLVHLLGTTVYMRLGNVQGLPYKTTVLGGRWDLRERGTRVFGALWILPAVGFVLAAIALFLDWPSWQWLLLSVTALSLILTVLDWASAYAGAVVNMAILLSAFLGPRLVALLNR